MKLRLTHVVAVIAVASIACAAPALAQQVRFHGAMVDASALLAAPSVPSVANPAGDAPESGSAPADTYGTTLYGTYNAGPCDVAVRSGTMTLLNCDYVRSAGAADVDLGFPVHIPTGVVVQYARIYFNETALADNISAGFWRTDQFGSSSLIAGMTPTATTSGNTMEQFGPFSEVINNAPSSGYQYSFLAITSGATRIYKMMVYFKLAVSAAPAVATFPNDVPTTHPFYQFIEALAASSITSGCGPGSYCPNDPVTRGQMAVFLSKALGLSYQY